MDKRAQLVSRSGEAVDLAAEVLHAHELADGDVDLGRGRRVEEERVLVGTLHVEKDHVYRWLAVGMLVDFRNPRDGCTAISTGRRAKKIRHDTIRWPNK